MSDKSEKYIDLGQLGCNDNPPLTKTGFGPKKVALLAKRMPQLVSFLETLEGQEIARRKDLSIKQKLAEAFRVLREKEKITCPS